MKQSVCGGQQCVDNYRILSVAPAVINSVGSIVTFEETIDFSGKHRGFDFDFFWLP